MSNKGKHIEVDPEEADNGWFPHTIDAGIYWQSTTYIL